MGCGISFNSTQQLQYKCYSSMGLSRVGIVFYILSRVCLFWYCKCLGWCSRTSVGTDFTERMRNECVPQNSAFPLAFCCVAFSNLENFFMLSIAWLPWVNVLLHVVFPFHSLMVSVAPAFILLPLRICSSQTSLTSSLL